MAGQHRSSTSTAVERGQQYCGGHGQEGPDWQRLLLPLSNLLVPCSQIDFGMNCCGRAQPEAAGHGAGWGGGQQAGLCRRCWDRHCCPVTFTGCPGVWPP